MLSVEKKVITKLLDAVREITGIPVVDADTHYRINDEKAEKIFEECFNTLKDLPIPDRVEFSFETPCESACKAPSKEEQKPEQKEDNGPEDKESNSASPDCFNEVCLLLARNKVNGTVFGYFPQSMKAKIRDLWQKLVAKGNLYKLTSDGWRPETASHAMQNVAYCIASKANYDTYRKTGEWCDGQSSYQQDQDPEENSRSSQRDLFRKARDYAYARALYKEAHDSVMAEKASRIGREFLKASPAKKEVKTASFPIVNGKIGFSMFHWTDFSGFLTEYSNMYDNFLGYEFKEYPGRLVKRRYYANDRPLTPVRAVFTVK